VEVKPWKRATAHQVQRKNESLQVLLLQRMEDALFQIVQEEVALRREPTTDGHDLEIRDATAVDGGLRAGRARSALRITHDKTR
jgi:hypothetical protein